MPGVLVCFCPSNTGGTGDEFFNENNREELLKIIKFDPEEEELKEKMRLFLRHCNVVLRTISTKAHIRNLEEFEGFCLEGNALMCEVFPFKLVAGSSHLLFGHAAHAIERNGHHGLGQLHEGGFQKCLLKFIKKKIKKKNLKKKFEKKI